MATIGALAGIAAAGASIYGASRAGSGMINGNQNDIAYRNYYLQRAMQRQQQQLAMASRTDARGNRTEYVDGLGWIETPTEQTAQINRAADAELRNNLTQDAVRQRLTAARTGERQVSEDQEARALLSQFGRNNESADGVRALLGNKLVAEASSGKDDLRRRIGMQNVRSGGGSEALAALARRSMPDTRTALATAALDAPALADQRNGARNSNTLNQYNMLASRASAMPGQVVNPISVPNNSAANLGNSSFAAIQGMASNRLQAPQLAGIQADPTTGRWAAVGDAIQGLAENPYIQQALRNWGSEGGTQQPAINRSRTATWEGY